MPTEDGLLLFLIKNVFFTTLLSPRQTHTNHIIHVYEIPMLITVYNHYDVSSEVSLLYLLHLILLSLLRFYLVSIVLGF
jgi:hypothetical protein